MTVKINECKSPNTHGIVLGENYCRLCTREQRLRDETKSIKASGEEE